MSKFKQFSQKLLSALKNLVGQEFYTKFEFNLQNAKYSTVLINNQVNDLLDLAKFENQSFQFNLDYFSIIEVIRQAFDQIKYQAD